MIEQTVPDDLKFSYDVLKAWIGEGRGDKFPVSTAFVVELIERIGRAESLFGERKQ